MADAHPVSLGKRLRQERELRHWTQEDLAEKIGRSVPSVNRWEHDRAEPQPDALRELTQLFGKPHDRWGTSRWNVPFLRNPYFTGKEHLLSRLHRTLAAEKTVALSQTRAISGLGGIGKTQIALEYAYRYAREYEAVLWVQADSHEVLISEFAQLAQTLDLPDKEDKDQGRIVSAVKRWLQEHSTWLLILDNADDLTVLTDMLPRGMGGATLVTTRSQVTGLHLKKLAVERMSREEGVSFLLQRIASSNDEETEEDPSTQVSEQERQAAEELWAMMDGLPLALDQAGAYIESAQCSFADYLDLYRNHRTTLLHERGGPIPEHPDAVATTWDLSFERVEQKNPAAAALLRLCAFLAPDAIPEELITEGATHLPAPLQTLTTSARLRDEAISTLRAYSLVQRDPTTRMLSLHRLVQAVLQDKLEETQRRTWAEWAIQAINATFPSVEHNTWSQCERLLTQALVAAQWIEQYHFTREEAVRLLSETASYLTERARYNQAGLLYQQALLIREPQVGSEHPLVAKTLNNLAELYRKQGKYAEAEPLYQRALTIREKTLGLEHPDVAETLNGLAVIYFEQGRYAEAEPLYQRALAIREKTLGPEHSLIAYPLNNLANIYSRQGKYEQAEPLYQRALAIREKTLGPEHPMVASPLNNLAITYYDQGKYAEAEPLYQRALYIREKQLGPEHPDIAQLHNNMANLYQKQGKYAEAELLYQRALHIWEQQFGPEHPDVAYPLDNLANLYQKQGKYAEVEPLYQRALYIREKQLGPEHPDVAETLNNLANFYFEQGRYAEAEPLYQRALRIREQQLRPEHLLVAETLNNLANLYRTQGQHERTELLYQRALYIREQQLGLEHPDTAETMHDLARYWEALDNSEEACTLYTRALAIREQALGTHHPKTMETRTRLISLLHAMGQHEDAAHKALVKIQETAEANTERNEQWELIRPSSAGNVYELSPSTQQAPSSSHGNQQTNQEHQIVLYSVARATLEKKDSALVGKVYRVQAGISQGELKDFQSEAFDLLVNSAHTSIAFDISLHTSENLELTTPWQQFLRYTIQNQEPQLVEFAFRALLPGESTLIFDFYHKQHLLKTMRLEFMAINQTSIPSRSTRGNV